MSHIYSFDEQKNIYRQSCHRHIFGFSNCFAELLPGRSPSAGTRHVALCITYTALFWKRKTLSYQTITVAIVSSCFAISFSSFLFMGLTGAGELFLVVNSCGDISRKAHGRLYSEHSNTYSYGISPRIRRYHCAFNVDAYQQEWGSWMLSVLSLCMACFVSIIVMQDFAQSKGKYGKYL